MSRRCEETVLRHAAGGVEYVVVGSGRPSAVFKWCGGWECSWDGVYVLIYPSFLLPKKKPLSLLFSSSRILRWKNATELYACNAIDVQKPLTISFLSWNGYTGTDIADNAPDYDCRDTIACCSGAELVCLVVSFLFHSILIYQA